MILSACALATLAATAALFTPLLTYALSLAVFGLPHVLAELRYVDLRFSARQRGSTLFLVLAALAALAATRIWNLTATGLSSTQSDVELALLLLVIFIALRVARGIGATTGALAALLVTLGWMWHAPSALVIFAFLHNLTPLAFLAERLRGAARRRAMLVATFTMAVIPLALFALAHLLTTHWPSSLAAGRIGGLEDHLRVYVPDLLSGGSAARPLFVVAAYLQVLHYAIVLHVLPRLVPESVPTSLLRWPARLRFTILLWLVSIPLTLAFFLDFRFARSAYGVAAGIHAWVEVPVLLAAITPRRRIRATFAYSPAGVGTP